MNALPSISGKTRLYAIVGDPIVQVRSRLPIACIRERCVSARSTHCEGMLSVEGLGVQEQVVGRWGD